MTTNLNIENVEWPDAVAIAAVRVLGGAPVASTLVIFQDGVTETGLWRVTAGEFTTVHDDYEEFIHIAEGDADLVHDDGTTITLAPGSVVLLQAGWRGRWVIRGTLTKSYTTVKRS